MRKLLCIAILAAGLLQARAQVGISIINAFPSANWSANNLVSQLSEYGVASNPGGIFDNPDFDLVFELDDQTIQTTRPFGTIVVDSIWLIIGAEYVGYNTTIDSNLTYTTSAANYLSEDVFISGAQAGTNNYLPFILNDSNDAPHFGWLQYELQSFTDNAVGINFIAGAINAIPDQAIQAGVVPETSTWALMSIGGLLLALRARRQRQ